MISPSELTHHVCALPNFFPLMEPYRHDLPQRPKKKHRPAAARRSLPPPYCQAVRRIDPKAHVSVRSGPRKRIEFELTCNVQWIGLRENLQENPIFNGKIDGFL